MSLFSLNELSRGPSAAADGSLVFKDKYIDAHTVKLESLRQLTGAIPSPGEIYFLWTLKSFNAFTFIPYLIKYSGAIEEIILSTYSITLRILEAFSRYHEKGLIHKTTLLVSDSVKFRLPRVNERLVQMQDDSFQVIYGWNHSKVTLIRTGSGHFVIEGSGNFSENAQFEQYVFMNSPKVWEFRSQCIKNSDHGFLRGDI